MKNSGKHKRFPLQDIYSKLHVQPETDRLVTGKQCAGTRDIVLVDMYISQKEGDRLQGKFYLPCHQVQVVNIGRQPEVRVAAALVGRQNQFPVIQLELYQTQAGCLITFGTSLTQKKHIVLAVALLPVDFRYQWRQLLEIGRITVHQDGTAIIPPIDAGLPVLLHVPPA